MADLKRLVTALKNADADGDTEGAAVLAKAIRKIQNGSELPAPDSYESQNFADRAASMSPQDLSFARSVSKANDTDGFADYLRNLSQKPVAGESTADREKRLYGGLTPNAPKKEIGMAEGTARAAVQGGFAGFGDNVIAAGQASIDALKRGDDFGRAYDVRLQNERNKLAQFKEESPYVAYPTEIAASIPTSILAGPANLASKGYLLNAAVPAIQGAVYGIGSGDSQNIGDAGVDAGIGLLSGAAGGTAGKFLGDLGSKIYQSVKQSQLAKQLGLSSDEAYTVLRNMSGDNSLTGGGAARISAAGPQAVLADSSPGAVKLLDTLTKRSPEASKQVNEVIETRLSAGKNALQGDEAQPGLLTETLGGPPKGARNIITGIAKQTAPARVQAYRAAYDQPVDYSSMTNIVERTLSRVPADELKAAIREANKQIQSADPLVDQVVQRQIKANIDEATNKVTFTEMPNVLQLDKLKISLGTLGEEAKKVLASGVKVATSESRRYSMLAKAVKEAIIEGTGGAEKSLYGKAVALGGDKIERQIGADLGLNFFNPSTTREMVTDFTQEMSQDAKKALMQGIRSNLDETLSKVKRTAMDSDTDVRATFELIKNLSSDNSRQKLLAVVGKENAEKLFKELDQTATAFELRAGISPNSKTFVRSNEDDVQKELATTLLSSLRQGFGPAAGYLTSKAFGQNAKKRIQNQGLSDENIAKFLTTTPQVKPITKPPYVDPTPRNSASPTAKLNALQSMKPVFDQLNNPALRKSLNYLISKPSVAGSSFLTPQQKKRVPTLLNVGQ